MTSEQPKSAATEQTHESFDPKYTVGWLVCVGGSYYGESFILKSGGNTIGRAPTMDISLAADMAVTEQAHTVVIYDSAENRFSVQPGETVKISYKNGEPVYKNEPLKAGDIITLGSTKLLLFPLIRNGFSWNNFKEEK